MRGRALLFGVLWLSAVLAIILGLKALGVDLSDITPERIRALLIPYGAGAPMLYVAAYSQPFVPLPASIMTMAAGLAFGPWWGLMAAVCGATLRACGQFLIARRLGRNTIARFLKGRTAHIDERIGARGFATVLLIRLIPNVPYDLQNLALGVSRVRFWPYALATLIGIVPASFAFVYFGDSLTNPAQTWKLLAAALLVIAVVWVQRRVTHRARIS